MGMIGYYKAVDEEALKDIWDGEVNPLDLDGADYPTLDADKAWQAICYVLCGDLCNGEPPLGYVVPLLEDSAVDCGFELGAYYVTPAQVKEAASALKEMDEAAFRGLYDLKALQEDGVYPVTGDEDGEEFFNYLHDYLLKIRAFYAQAGEREQGVLFYIL